MNTIVPYVSPLINYPKTSPQDSRYLPISPVRDYLSVLDKYANDCYLGIKKTIDKYKESDFFSRKIAIGLIDSVKEGMKPPLGKLLPEWGNLALRHFTEISEPYICELGDTVPASQLNLTIIKIIFAWLGKEMRESGEGIDKGPFNFTLEDYQNADVRSEDMSSERVLTCQDFAFYKLNDQWAKDYLFTKHFPAWPSLLRTDPCRFFCDQGYRLTTTPIPGDLVVYCSSLKGFLESKHYGIWTENQKVLGKQGITDVYEHPIENVIIGYGDFVYFFHKDITTALQADFLKMIKEVCSEMHYSPLTLSALSSKLIEMFQEIPITQIYSRSIYNHAYNLELRDQMTSELQPLTQKDVFNSRTELYEAFEQTTLLVSSKVRPRL